MIDTIRRYRITIIDKYIFKELMLVFIVGLSIVLSILYLEKIHFLSRLILDKGISLWEFAKLLLYVTPAFMVVAIPLALLIATLITFSRLSADNEITAMRACGIGFQRFLVPVMAAAVIIFIFNFILSVNLQHTGNFKYIKLLRIIITEKITLSLGERVFFDKIDSTVIYVDEKPSGSENLKGIFIYNGRVPDKPEYITAKIGKFVTVGGNVVLELTDGTTYVGDKNSFRLTRFKKYDLVFNTDPGKSSEYVIQPREMSITQMKKRIAQRKKNNQTYFSDEVEIYKRFTLPFSCIVLALIGAPLGIRSQRGSKWSGIGMGIMIIIVNYLLMMFSEGLGREGSIPPFIAVWIPNLVLGTLAFYLVYITSKEIAPSGRFGWFEPIVKAISSRIKKLREKKES